MSPYLKSAVTMAAALAATFAVFSFASSSESAGNRVTIEIRALAFAPVATVLEAGDTVVWVNNDIIPHTATAEDGSWDSGEIAPGGTWEMQISRGMVMDYFCAFHPTMTANLNM